MTELGIYMQLYLYSTRSSIDYCFKQRVYLLNPLLQASDCDKDCVKIGNWSSTPPDPTRSATCVRVSLRGCLCVMICVRSLQYWSKDVDICIQLVRSVDQTCCVSKTFVYMSNQCTVHKRYLPFWLSRTASAWFHTYPPLTTIRVRGVSNTSK